MKRRETHRNRGESLEIMTVVQFYLIESGKEVSPLK